MQDTNSAILLVVLALMLLLSAFFSASETSYSSLNQIRLKNRAETDKKAARALKLVGCYDNLLSSILIGNNIVNIVATSLATVLFVGWMGNVGVTVSTIVITVLVLIFGEITPKTLAKESPENFAIFAAPILNVLIVILRPVNFLFERWKRLIVKLFHIRPDKSITEQELLSYVGEAREVGGINEREETMIRSAIEFDDLEAGDIVTPRVDITAVGLDADVEDIRAAFVESGFSRLLVYNDSIDDIVGMLLEKDFYHHILDRGLSLSRVVRPVIFTTGSIHISVLLRQMQKQRSHMAVVIDEYGGTVGIVTTEDILEELVGDIWDENEEIVDQITPLSGGRYRVLADTDLDDLLALIGGEDDDSDSLSVGGWVCERLGHLPKKGEGFCFNGYTITVIGAGATKVHEIELAPQPDDKEQK